MKPFLKWAGGKTQLLDVIKEEMPKELSNINTYIEPFIGAGAVFFDFLENDLFDKYIINDINIKLINTYMVIRDNVEILIEKLEKLKKIFLNLDENLELKKEMYYNVRDLFNSNSIDNIDLAVYFIFLNKTCFNGLYRENSKGRFNVPIGSYKAPTIFEAEQLRKVSILLNKTDKDGNLCVEILNTEYFNLIDKINTNTFVYFDPPYRPVTKGGFNAYSSSGFNDNHQIELAKFYNLANFKGAKLMLSNSDPKNLDENDDFFDDLYKEYNIIRVDASRTINSNSKKRGKISEILVKNYKD